MNSTLNVTPPVHTSCIVENFERNEVVNSQDHICRKSHAIDRRLNNFEFENRQVFGNVLNERIVLSEKDLLTYSWNNEFKRAENYRMLKAENLNETEHLHHKKENGELKDSNEHVENNELPINSQKCYNSTNLSSYDKLSVAIVSFGEIFCAFYVNRNSVVLIKKVDFLHLNH